MMTEFRKIKGSKNYLIKEDGIVISLARKIKYFNQYKKTVYYNLPSKILRPQNAGAGYQRVNLDKQKFFYVHRLVADAFLKKPKGKGLEIDHLDFDKQNNRKDNLRWTTKKENVSRSIPSRKGPKRQKPIIGFKNGKVIGEFKSVSEAGRILKIPFQGIGRVCRGEGKTNHGIVWKFKRKEDGKR